MQTILSYCSIFSLLVFPERSFRVLKDVKDTNAVEFLFFEQWLSVAVQSIKLRKT